MLYVANFAVGNFAIGDGFEMTAIAICILGESASSEAREKSGEYLSLALDDEHHHVLYQHASRIKCPAGCHHGSDYHYSRRDQYLDGPLHQKTRFKGEGALL